MTRSSSASALFCALTIAAGCTAAAVGCSSCRRDACCRHTIEAELAERMASEPMPAVSSAGGSTSPVLPNGADWSDGLSEDEAVLIGLWNNAAFREALVELNLAHADLVQAGLLPNPEFVYYFPAPEKPLKWICDFPIEALWLRPIRVAAAERENQRVCRRLTQLGLDLIRDIRTGHSELALAHGRYHVAEEAVRLREQLAALARARFEAGDISLQESTTAKIDALAARQDLTRLGYERDWAEERLRNLMGIGLLGEPIEPATEPVPSGSSPGASNLTDPPPDIEFLVARALEDRPDMQAAAAAVAAADQRLRLARRVFFRFLGIFDATSGRASGHEFSPAYRVTVPLFNLNQGAVARAEAERDQAARRRATLHDQIIMETRQSHIRYRQAADEWRVLQSAVRPEVEAAIRRADAAYRAGETSYTVALETTRQLIDSRMREQQLLADLRRSRAELERNVGRRLDRYELPVEAEEVPSPDGEPNAENLPAAPVDASETNKNVITPAKPGAIRSTTEDAPADGTPPAALDPPTGATSLEPEAIQ